MYSPSIANSNSKYLVKYTQASEFALRNTLNSCMTAKDIIKELESTLATKPLLIANSSLALTFLQGTVQLTVGSAYYRYRLLALDTSWNWTPASVDASWIFRRQKGVPVFTTGPQNHVNMGTPGCPYLRGVQIFMTQILIFRVCVMR